MLPKTVKIGAQVYKVRVLPPWDENTLGDNDCSTNLIRLRKGLPASRQIDTFLHECIHVMLEGHDFALEEAIVSLLGEGITSLIQNNPEFFLHALDELADPRKIRNLLDKRKPSAYNQAVDEKGPETRGR